MTTVLVILAILGGGRFYLLGQKSSTLTPQIGVQNARLRDCPKKPNCVSSFESNDHYITPLKTNLSFTEVKKKLKKQSGFKLISTTKNYMHFTYTSSVFSFVDDIELLFIDDLIHIRSASRVGYSDLGSNKKRVEKIREILISP